jgi:protease I
MKRVNLIAIKIRRKTPMATTTLSDKKIAIMVANGFDEARFIEIQKMLLAVNARLKVIAPGAGLAHGRNGDQAGMSYPVDAQLSETLAVDYDGLVIPSGDQHISVLSDELHASRIIRAFMRENMPVLVQGNAIDLVAEIDKDIDGEAIKSAGVIAEHNHLLWISEDTSLAEASRKFVANCLAAIDESEEDGGDSAAA